MRVLHRRRYVTLAAAVRLFRLNRHVAGVIVVFDLVTRDASVLQRGMNVLSCGMIGVALNAVRMFIDASGMRPGVA
jgi:hypothetical protein